MCDHDQIKSKDKAVELWLVSGQGDYFWSMVNGAYIPTIHFKCNLCKYTALYKIMQFTIVTRFAKTRHNNAFLEIQIFASVSSI